jgi:hypothetical protein
VIDVICSNFDSLVKKRGDIRKIAPAIAHEQLDLNMPLACGFQAVQD